MTDFKEGDTAFTLASVGLAFVPEQCSFGSGEDSEHDRCNRLAGFLIGVDCTDDEEGYQTCFVVCVDHLAADLVMLAEAKIEREREASELLTTAWIARSQFLDHEVGREPEALVTDFHETVERFGLEVEQVFGATTVKPGDAVDEESASFCYDCGMFACECKDAPDDEGVNDMTCAYYFTDKENLKSWRVKCDCGYVADYGSRGYAKRNAEKHTAGGHAYLARPE